MDYHLVSCDDAGIIIVTSENLSQYLNQVVTLKDYEGCFKVTPAPIKVTVTVEDYYVSCKGCQPKCFIPKC
jgi:hypothetical protein